MILEIVTLVMLATAGGEHIGEGPSIQDMDIKGLKEYRVEDGELEVTFSKYHMWSTKKMPKQCDQVIKDVADELGFVIKTRRIGKDITRSELSGINTCVAWADIKDVK